MRINKKAFTLIELLVVITIVAILALAVFLSFSDEASKARNTVRLDTLTKVSDAINYGVALDGDVLTTTAATGAKLQASTLKTGAAVRLPKMQADPKNSGIYVYGYASDASTFKVVWVLEQQKVQLPGYDKVQSGSTFASFGTYTTTAGSDNLLGSAKSNTVADDTSVSWN